MAKEIHQRAIDIFKKFGAKFPGSEFSKMDSINPETVTSENVATILADLLEALIDKGFMAAPVVEEDPEEDVSGDGEDEDPEEDVSGDK